MARYVKKPIEIEAFQTDKELIIHTLEGDMKANVGDYIITGVEGEQYPCKPNIFEKTYEIATNNTADVVPRSEVEKLTEERDKYKKYYYNTSYAGEGQMYHRKRGNAQLVETGYNGRGLGVNVSLRRLEWMDSRIVTDASSSVNMINYVPAMCTQYTYMLTTLHPYGARTGDISSKFTNSGEMGGQLDSHYSIIR